MSQFVETTRQGFGSRAKSSFGGIIFGILLLALSCFVLFWNEGRAVKRYKDLKEGAGTVVEIPADKVDAANEGSLVHISGNTVVGAPISDRDFGVSEEAIKLIRKVEMFQWVETVRTETSNNTGGSQDTKKTYSYSTKWKEGLVNSAEFKVTNGHQNPIELKYQSATQVSESVTVGAFDLPPFLVQEIGGAESYTVTTLDKAAPEIRDTAMISDGGVYFGAAPINPAVGDVRVRFSIVRPGPVSVVAQQSAQTFVPYVAKTGGKVSLLESKVISAAEMFQLAQDRNKVLTWAIRGGGFVLLGVGFSMLLKPLSVFASVLPFLGRIVDAGVGLISFLLAAIVWTITVAIAWIFYRPLLGIGILVITGVLIFFVFKQLRKGRSAAAESAPPSLDTPPPLA